MTNRHKSYNNYGSDDKWVVGRMNPHGKNWLKEYAQKDFSRTIKPSLIKRLLNKLNILENKL
tara:strand:- start:1525 stop:1710 length:186 start_codon:yes stop_codon:yes gene_type:complete